MPNPSLPPRKLCLSPQLLSLLNIFMTSTELAVEDSDQLACEGANSSLNAVCSSMERLCFDLQNPTSIPKWDWRFWRTAFCLVLPGRESDHNSLSLSTLSPLSWVINNMAIAHHFLVVWNVSPKYTLSPRTLGRSVCVFCPDKLSYTHLSRLLLNSLECRYPTPQPQPPPHSVHSTLNWPVTPYLISSSDRHPSIGHQVPHFRLLSKGFRSTKHFKLRVSCCHFNFILGSTTLKRKGQQNKHGASNEETWVEAPVTPLTTLLSGLDKVILHSSKILNAHPLLVKIHYFFIYLLMQQLSYCAWHYEALKIIPQRTYHLEWEIRQSHQ